MSIAEDIKKARAAGHSDDEILGAITKFQPGYSGDVAKARASDHSSAVIVDAIQKHDATTGPWNDYVKQSGPWDEYSPEAQRSTLDKVTAPLRYGVSQAARGIQSTLHETGNDGTASGVAGSVADATAPEFYTPAHVSLNPKTWGDIPQAIAEAVPGMAPDLAAGAAGAAIGGPIGGVIGAAGSYALRNYGPDLRATVIARGGTDTTEPTSGDKARALIASGVGGLASRIGLKAALGAPVKAAGDSMASQIATQALKGAGTDAATNVGQEAIHQALIDQKLDPSALGGAAVTGAATGGAMRVGSAVLRDAQVARKFAGISPEEAAPVVQKLQDVHGENYTGSAKQDYQALSKVSSDLGVRVNSLVNDPNVQGHLAALKKADPFDATAETLQRVRADIKASRLPDASDMQDLSSTIGQLPHGAALLASIREQSILDRIKSQGNYDEKAGTFSGGLASSPAAQAVVNPLSKLGLAADAGVALSTITHAVSPAAALAIPAAQGAGYVALRGVDAFTGNRSPLTQFANRFRAAGAPDLTDPASHPGQTFAEQAALARDTGRQQRVQQRATAQSSDVVPPSSETLGASSTPQGSSTAASVAQGLRDSRTAGIAASEALRASQGPSGANGGETTVAVPHMTYVNNPDAPGGRIGVPTENIRGSATAWAAGVTQNMNARRSIVEAALDLPLSPAGKLAVAVHGQDILRAAAGSKSPEAAAKAILKHSGQMSAPDRAALLHHLATASDPLTGKTFDSTWAN